ncbi:methyltransferase-like protein 27 isoform X2 [Scyliorhinus canicula]|uniref:methyltransferase-like protein 27 isoform X2 n=1 Tax=Scyliorhinus canicula TaxID=7830 RepID=UPI0018F30985|nr:methyltransferase-like protein 27 isoform X2 [Scyliorhinus canicula]
MGKLYGILGDHYFGPCPTLGGPAVCGENYQRPQWRMTEAGRDTDADISIRNLLTVYNINQPDKKITFYNTWAKRYEKDLAVINYQAHVFAAEVLDPVFPKERDNALVLDVACGTGGVAEQLKKLGFKNFHGIDGSEGMLKVAESKGLYQSLKKFLIVPGEQLPAPSDTYDLVIVVGALSYGLLSLDVLPELLRVAKPGAFICLSTKDEMGREYMQQLLVCMDELESKGLWIKVVKKKIDHWQKIVLPTELSSEYISGLVAIYRKSD